MVSHCITFQESSAFRRTFPNVSNPCNDFLQTHPVCVWASFRTRALLRRVLSMKVSTIAERSGGRPSLRQANEKVTNQAHRQHQFAPRILFHIPASLRSYYRPVWSPGSRGGQSNPKHWAPNFFRGGCGPGCECKCAQPHSARTDPAVCATMPVLLPATAGPTGFPESGPRSTSRQLFQCRNESGGNADEN